MSGDYDSIIAIEKAEKIARFTTGISKGRFIPANGEATLSGVLTEFDQLGKAVGIKAIKFGGKIGSDTI